MARAKLSPEKVFEQINIGTEMYLHSLVESRLLIQASSGGGKSYMLRVLTEQVIRHMPVILLDWEGEFATLRERHDLVLAGPGGETSCDVKSAAMLARSLIELEVSAIIDMSELKTTGPRQEYAAVFLNALVNLPKKLWPSRQGKAVMIMVDESHKICPQKERSQAASAVIDLQSLGRKRGLCGVLATQRLSKLDKDAAAECNNVLIGRCSSIDAAKACDMLGVASSSKHELTRLATGEWRGVGPAFVRDEHDISSFDGCVSFRGAVAATTHAKSGATLLTPPKPSRKIKKVIPLLEAAQVKTAKEIKDLGEAKKEITNLKRQVTLAKKENPEPKVETVTEIDYEAVERAVKARDEQWEPLLTAATKQIRDLLERFKRVYGTVVTEFEAGVDAELDAKTLACSLADLVPPGMAKGPVLKAAERKKSTGRRTKRTGRKKRTAPPADAVGEEPNASELKILGALTWLASVGVHQPSRPVAGVMAGYKPGGRFNNLLGSLNTKEHIWYPCPGTIEITDSGVTHAPEHEEPPTLQDLWDAWQSKLSNSQWKLIEVVLEETFVKDALTPALLAEQSGYTVGGRFNNLLGSLRTLGLITKRGAIEPTELLYPEGL